MTSRPCTRWCAGAWSGGSARGTSPIWSSSTGARPSWSARCWPPPTAAPATASTRTSRTASTSTAAPAGACAWSCRRARAAEGEWASALQPWHRVRLLHLAAPRASFGGEHEAHAPCFLVHDVVILLGIKDVFVHDVVQALFAHMVSQDCIRHDTPLPVCISNVIVVQSFIVALYRMNM